MDFGSMDAGTMDAGTMDFGSIDAGTMNTGTMDAGTMDTGTMDTNPISCSSIDFFPSSVGSNCVASDLDSQTGQKMSGWIFLPKLRNCKKLLRSVFCQNSQKELFLDNF